MGTYKITRNGGNTVDATTPHCPQCGGECRQRPLMLRFPKDGYFICGDKAEYGCLICGCLFDYVGDVSVD